MIEITPAILTDKLDHLVELAGGYVQTGFASIDIDFAQAEFVHNHTVPVAQVLGAIDRGAANWGWHLMLQDPESDYELITKAYGANLNRRIYVHQEANLHFLEDVDLTAAGVGLAIKSESHLKGVEYYNRFPEIQLMTIVSGAQGARFIPEILDRVNTLRMEGYAGKISLDGGINLLTAKLVREYDVNRVSVGSYFQNSRELDLDWQKLDLALNL